MRVRVRLMNDYTVDWPLWLPDGGASEDELPVPEHLRSRVRAWADVFNTLYHYERGWPTRHHLQQHRREGERLRVALAEDLGPGFDVVLDYWETGVDGATR